MSDEEFYLKYFASKGVNRQVCDAVLRVIRYYLAIEKAPLDPKDKLVDDLMICGDDLSLGITRDLEKEFNIKLKQEDVNNIYTLEDLILALDRGSKRTSSAS